MERYALLFFGLQGGGVYVYSTPTYSNGVAIAYSNGVANFESCNIHDNTANYVRLHL